MNRDELEWRLLYSVVVAGKSAAFADHAMRKLFAAISSDDTPFCHLARLVKTDRIGAALREARTGNYHKLDRCIRQIVVAPLDLENCGPEELEKIHGIGPKTSRFFILWTRPDASFAALDTHVLKWLRHIGHAAPKSTPNGATYRKLEIAFLEEAKARGVTARELDAAIWDWCSVGGQKGGRWPENLQPREAVEVAG